MGRENGVEEWKGEKKKENNGGHWEDGSVDTARVYQAKWLCLSIQLKWIKEYNDWQSLHWSYNFLNLICCPFYAPQSSAPSSTPPSSSSSPSPLPPLSICITVNLLFHKRHTPITLYYLWAANKAYQCLCALSFPQFHVKKIRSADWFVFVSRCSVAAVAIGNPWRQHCRGNS